MRWRVFAGVTLLAAVAPAPAAHAAVPVLVVDGSGWGHGVGMAQDGAYWMGRAGTDTAGILRQFYPGTSMSRTGGSVRVGIATIPSGEVVLGFPGGGQVRDDATGVKAFPLQVPPGGQVVVGSSGGATSMTLVTSTPGPGLSVTANALRATPPRG